ncbi:MAG: DUF5652 family protein [bacterium]|nr:DUF5652 family protein [bacterium]
MDRGYMDFFNLSGMASWHPAWSATFIVLTIWVLYWKYRSMWLAAKKDNKRWFIALLIINTLGILEILYIYVFSKQMSGHDEKSVPMVP